MIAIVPESDIKNRSETFNKELENFVGGVLSENAKKKFPLFICGNGISQSIPYEDELLKMPNMLQIVAQLVEITERSYRNEGIDIPNELATYINDLNASPELKESNARIISFFTYRDYNNNKGFSDKDREILYASWSEMLHWLLKSCLLDTELIGIVDAEPSVNHMVLARCYQLINAICLTTNFDNILCKALKKVFDNENDMVYPLISNDDCKICFGGKNQNENKVSRVEIQARGDIFWTKCLGGSRPTCSKIGENHLLSAEYINIDKKSIICTECGSPLDIDIAFPGSYEKDKEMRTVLTELWRYIAFGFSHIIICGSSFNWDPILRSFVYQLLIERKVSLIYISPKNESMTDIEKYFFTQEEAFGDSSHVWFQGEAEHILPAFEEKLLSLSSPERTYVIDFVHDIKDIGIACSIIDSDDEDKDMLKISGVEKKIIESDYFKTAKNTSQLGLKSYWLNGTNSTIINHNRCIHSVNTMFVASHIYKKIKLDYYYRVTSGVRSLCAATDSRKNDDSEFQLLRLAALLHDVGHLPFSHLIEQVFDELSWKPSLNGGTHFDHTFYTINIIKRINSDESTGLAKVLGEIGHTLDDLLSLINGEFGIGYLDALINSPIDADKIEYLYNDSKLTNSKIEGTQAQYLEDFTNNLSVSQFGLLEVNGKSADSALQLLEIRHKMYLELYLRQGLRFLEGCVKYILKMFFVHYCEERIWEIIRKDEQIIDCHIPVDYMDLGDIKINYVIDLFLDIINNDVPLIKDEPTEKIILTILKERLAYLRIDPNVRSALDNCFDKVLNTDSESAVNIFEETIETFPIPKSVPDAKIEKHIKTVSLRFPGTIVIDMYRTPAFLSYSEGRKVKWRADDTCVTSENILMPEYDKRDEWKLKNTKASICLGDCLSEKLAESKTERFVNIYFIGPNHFRNVQASDYFKSLITE